MSKKKKKNKSKLPKALRGTIEPPSFTSYEAFEALINAPGRRMLDEARAARETATTVIDLIAHDPDKEIIVRWGDRQFTRGPVTFIPVESEPAP